MRISRINPWAGLGGLPRGVYLLCAVILVNRLTSMVLPFLVLYCASELGFSTAASGLALTSYGLGSMLIQPYAGVLADRIGAQRVMVTSLLATAGILLLFPLARTGPAVFAAAFLLAIASDGFRPASLAVLNDLVEGEQRRPAIALHRLALNLGLSVGPAVGGFLAESSFTTLFLIDASGALTAGLVLMCFPLRVTAHAASSAPALGAWRDRRLQWFLLANVLVAIVFFQHEAALPLHMEFGLDLPRSDFGLVFTINTLLIVLLEVRLVLAVARWRYARTLGIGALLLAAGFGLLAVWTTRWGVFGSVVVWTFAEMLLLPAMANYVGELAPHGRRGEYMGLYTMSWAVALVLGSWAGPAALGQFGPEATWSGAAAIGLVAAAMLVRIRS